MEKYKYIKYLEKENSNLKQIIEKSLTLEELIINYEDYKKLKKIWHFRCGFRLPRQSRALVTGTS